jgi:hypothetical protein
MGHFRVLNDFNGLRFFGKEILTIGRMCVLMTAYAIARFGSDQSTVFGPLRSFALGL